MKKITLFLFLIPLLSFAQNFRASVDKTVLEIGDRLTVTYSTDGDGTNFRAPKFSDFKLLMGPSQSQNIQIINGKISRSLSFSFVLEAIKEGKFTIPAATITIDGKEINSNTVQVQVLPPSQAKLERMKKEKEQEENTRKQAIDLINENLKIEVQVDKTTAYIGEPVVATYRILMHPQLAVLQLTPEKTPQLNGFWNQEIDIGKIEYNLQNINNKTYQVAVIKKVILFPQQSGKLLIDSYEFNTTVRLQIQGQRRQRNDPFDQFFDSFFDDFFNRTYKDFNTIVKSPTITINVKELPKNAPLSFTNAVGSFSVNSWLDKTTTKTGEAVTYRLKIEGKGNLKLLTPPTLNLPSNIETYDPKIVDNTRVTSSNVEGNIVYEFVLIPQTPGEYKIPPFEFSYFDLNTKQYITQTTKELILKVIQGEKNIVVGGVSKEDIQYLNQDIDFIKTDIGTSSNSIFFSTFHISLMILPFLLLFLVIFILKRKKEQLENQTIFRQSQARKLAKKRLSTAKKYLDSKQYDKFTEEINKAVWGFLSDKFAIEYAKLTRNNIEEYMIKAYLNNELINETIELLDKAEYSRYAPQSQESDFMNLYNEAENIIYKIEDTLR